MNFDRSLQLSCVCCGVLRHVDYQNHQTLTNDSEGGGASFGSASSKSSAILGNRDPNATAASGSSYDKGGFRPTLEHHMQRALEQSFSGYGVDIKTFALQSFNPPPALAAQLTTALARRTEAKYQYEAQQINNQTILGQAETEATAIRTRAAAVARATELTAGVPHACLLQVLDKQVEIARAWSNGRATTLVLGSVPGMDSNNNMGSGPRSQQMPPLMSISELAGGLIKPDQAAAESQIL